MFCNKKNRQYQLQYLGHFSLTSLGSLTEPFLWCPCPFPSYPHQLFSEKLASPVQSIRHETMGNNRELVWSILVLVVHSFHQEINQPPPTLTTDAWPSYDQQRGAEARLWEKLTCLCLISSFFCSRKADGMPAMLSWALSSRGHKSFMNSRAFLPFRKPVRLICIILLSGCCNTHTKEERKDQMAIEILEVKISWGGRIPLVGLPTF